MDLGGIEWAAREFRGAIRGDVVAVGISREIEVEAVSGMVPLAATARVLGRTVVGYRRSLPWPIAHHAIAHEFGHLAFRLFGMPDGESEADYFAAALIMPVFDFRASMRALGDDVAALASAFKVTQTCAALRLGEVMRHPLALVSPNAVRVRGPEEHVWPPEQRIRRFAERGGPGLVRTRLTDDTRRVMLRAVGE